MDVYNYLYKPNKKYPYLLFKCPMNQTYSTGITTILTFKKIEGKRIVSNDFRFLNFELTPVNQGEQATDLL
jgi:hypothetical protein